VLSSSRVAGSSARQLSMGGAPPIYPGLDFRKPNWMA
jgi:hypothetical protein